MEGSGRLNSLDSVTRCRGPRWAERLGVVCGGPPDCWQIVGSLLEPGDQGYHRLWWPDYAGTLYVGPGLSRS